MFHPNWFSIKNRPLGDHGAIVGRKMAEGVYRSIFDGEPIWMKHSLFDATFHADSEYDIHFAREYSTDTQNIEKKVEKREK